VNPTERAWARALSPALRAWLVHLRLVHLRPVHPRQVSLPQALPASARLPARVERAI